MRGRSFPLGLALFLLRVLTWHHRTSWFCSSYSSSSCCTALLLVFLPGWAQLHSQGQQVFPQKHGRHTGVSVPQHACSPQGQGEDVNGDQAEPRVQSLLTGSPLSWQVCGPQLCEGHTWQKQQKGVAIEEDQALCPNWQPLLYDPSRSTLGLPQARLQVQHIQQVHHDPQEPTPHFLLPALWSHVVSARQDEKQGGQADGQQQRQRLPCQRVRRPALLPVIVADEEELQLEEWQEQEPEGVGEPAAWRLRLRNHAGWDEAQSEQEADVT